VGPKRISERLRQRTIYHQSTARYLLPDAQDGSPRPVVGGVVGWPCEKKRKEHAQAGEGTGHSAGDKYNGGGGRTGKRIKPQNENFLVPSRVAGKKRLRQGPRAGRGAYGGRTRNKGPEGGPTSAQAQPVGVGSKGNLMHVHGGKSSGEDRDCGAGKKAPRATQKER